MHADEEHRANELEHQLYELQQQWENEKKQNLRMPSFDRSFAHSLTHSLTHSR